MRWALRRGAIAITTMIALAFVMPLGLALRQFAHQNTITQAQRQAAAVGAVLVVTRENDAIEEALNSPGAEGPGRVAVHLPGGRTVGDVVYDLPAEPSEEPRAETISRADGQVVLQPVLIENDQTVTIEVFVPNSALNRGLARSLLVLGGVALTLVILSTIVADRMANKMVRSTAGLVETARAFGSGRMDARASTQGPHELRDLGVAFNAMADRMQWIVQAERELAADISHRLRTPLTALRLNVERLPDGTHSDELKAITRSLENEIDEVIRAARHGRDVAEGASCDATAVVRERFEFWSVLAEDQGRTAQLVAPHGPLQMMVGKDALAAAVDVLLSNVFRHTREGTPLSVTLGSEGRYTVLTVEDAGPGFDDLEAALARGSQTTRLGSTGLGLDIVKRTVEQAGGRLRLGRSLWGGARVVASVPRESLTFEEQRPTRRRSSAQRRSRR